ncbi:hypothetical protein MKQ68_13935 [Chitinophaga horti]|uniref:Uncharacterized protein n=1 Tax=Chitinophaga horti TaxID=2920382 RepID=A0ABY6IV02_9BACT|nr:hypothetical protein [Chitinophaga horti]UYQ91191.1 hypothetical protein MKQ68_13935 [Chitinophaga horti]
MRKTINNRKLYSMVGALLLLALLFSSNIIQVLHTHHPETTTVADADEDCEVCAYCNNHAGKELLLTHPPILDTPLPAAIVLNGKTYARIYKFTLQGFSNKGPPSCPTLA